MRTRYAPTPSGFLHIGNAANFVTTYLVTRGQDAEIYLRIDDMDADRVRDDYLQDVFHVPEWLELPWTAGPTSTRDLDDWTQASRMHHYRKALEDLHQTGLTYACWCSRTQWVDYRGENCPGDCRRHARSFEVGSSAWRLHIPGRADPVVWRRDDRPAYHLSSVVDDDLWRIDVIVRGSDLRESTDIQRHLSSLLPDSTFGAATVLHHELATDAGGRKLAKSSGQMSRPMERTDALKREVYAMASGFAERIPIDPTRSFGC